jgi:hypothetical protein
MKKTSQKLRERGAIVFIVAMTLAVLASLGLFALVAAAGEVKTAGHERQNLQSHYLSETGVVAAALAINQIGDGITMPMTLDSGSGKVGDFDPGQPRNHCWSLAAVPNTAPNAAKECKILLYRPPYTGGVQPDLFGALNVNNFNTAANFSCAPPSAACPPPSPNRVLSPAMVDPELRVEVTDMFAGATLNKNATGGQQLVVYRPCTVTVTTYGETLPTSGYFGGAGLEVGRARVTFLSSNNNCR